MVMNPENTENVPQNTNNEYDKYSKEQLELISLYNQTMLSKTAYEQVYTHQAETHAQSLAKGEIDLKVSDLSLQMSREALRPHRMYHTEVMYNVSERNYICRCISMFGYDDEEEGALNIMAYGDTPAQACANFDYLWLHGKMED